MEDVLAIYEQAYTPTEPVVCLNEKPITLHAEMRLPSAAEPGRESRRDSEYERYGTTNIFCAVEPKARPQFTFAKPDRSAVQFAQVAFELAMQYPDETTIHLVIDNLNIHRRESLTDLLGEEIGGAVWDRFTVYSTPTHGCWLNQAEIEIGLMSRQCLGATKPRSKNSRPGSSRIEAGSQPPQNPDHWNFDRRAARREFSLQN